ncbi:MAG: response regulator, partial [Alphaproteobacteria bacterium]
TQKVGGQLPDVIISDLHMDGMDGMEFCNTLRRSKKLEIPVIILTGDSDRLLHETTLQVGAVAIMTKPVSAGDLLQKIEEVVGFSAT